MECSAALRVSQSSGITGRCQHAYARRAGRTAWTADRSPSDRCSLPQGLAHPLNLRRPMLVSSGFAPHLSLGNRRRDERSRTIPTDPHADPASWSAGCGGWRHDESARRLAETRRCARGRSRRRHPAGDPTVRQPGERGSDRHNRDRAHAARPRASRPAPSGSTTTSTRI